MPAVGAEALQNLLTPVRKLLVFGPARLRPGEATLVVRPSR